MMPDNTLIHPFHFVGRTSLARNFIPSPPISSLHQERHSPKKKKMMMNKKKSNIMTNRQDFVSPFFQLFSLLRCCFSHHIICLVFGFILLLLLSLRQILCMCEILKRYLFVNAQAAYSNYDNNKNSGSSSGKKRIFRVTTTTTRSREKKMNFHSQKSGTSEHKWKCKILSKYYNTFSNRFSSKSILFIVHIHSAIFSSSQP